MSNVLLFYLTLVAEFSMTIPLGFHDNPSIITHLNSISAWLRLLGCFVQFSFA